MEPDIGDMIDLHSMVYKSQSAHIQKLIFGFNKKMLKQMLLIYLEFFFDSNNRYKYFNTNRPKLLSIHSKIINSSNLTLKTIHKNKIKSSIHKVSECLLSQCISFLNQKDRSSTARIDVKWFKASCSSTSKYHLKITNRFINTEMIKPSHQFQYGSIGSLEMKKGLKCKKREGLRMNYDINLLKILSSPSLKSYKGEINQDLLPIFKNNMKSIDAVTVTGDGDECKFPTKDIILSAKSVTATCNFSMWRTPYLWMNDKDSKIFSILYANEDIKKYMLQNSKYVQYTFYNDDIMITIPT